MSVGLNNITTSNGYSEQNTLRAAGSQRLTLFVRNAAIYYQLGQGVAGVQWDEEKFLPPGTLSSARSYDTVRVRSAAAGVPAQVTIDADAGSA